MGILSALLDDDLPSIPQYAFQGTAGQGAWAASDGLRIRQHRNIGPKLNRPGAFHGQRRLPCISNFHRSRNGVSDHSSWIRSLSGSFAASSSAAERNSLFRSLSATLTSAGSQTKGFGSVFTGWARINIGILWSTFPYSGP